MNLFLPRCKIIYFLIIFLLLLESSSLVAKQLPVEANILWEREFIHVAPIDFEQDSIDELVIILDDYIVEPKDQNLNALIGSRFLNFGTFKPGKSGVGGVDSNNIWVWYIQRDSLFLYDIWPRREIFIANGNDIAKPDGWDSNAQQVILNDINADGNLELLVTVSTGFDLKPRGIYALDWLTGELLWKFLCGPVPTTLLLKDLNGDRKSEILCATAAPGNGNVENGTDDLHTYVFLLNTDGKLLWSKLIGLYSSWIELSWLNNKETDSNQIFVCEVGFPAGGRKHDSLFVLNANNGEVIFRNQYGKYNCGHTVIKNTKGEQFIVIGGNDDTLRILDDKLNLVRKRALQGGGCRKISHGNFAGKGRDEIVVQSNNNQLFLFDLNLKLLSQILTGSFSGLQPLRNKMKSRLLLASDRYEQPYWRLMEFNVIPVLSRSVTIGTLITVALVLFFVFGLTLVYSRYRQTRDVRTVIRRLTGQAGVIELNKKGEIKHTNLRARDIVNTIGGNINSLPKIGPLATIVESAKTIAKEPAAKTVQETVISITPEQTYLVRCFPIKKGALLTFEDISAVEYLKRVTTWAPVAQKLAHGIKNPLATILGAVEQVEIKLEDNGLKKYIGYVKDEISKLKKMSDGFMRFTKTMIPILKAQNINEVIKKTTAKYEATLPEEIKIEYDLDENLQALNLDEEGISNALSIIIENSVEAIKKGGIIRIRTIPEERLERDILKQYIRIEISDTGKGISTKYLEKVFEPYFTHEKPLGTGLGLTLAKKIIEDHKGYIELHSKEGVGTQVNIYLPL